MDKHGLAEFLRSRRERITPSGVGLPAGRRRRTPGLRRDEVARLAAISTEYYTRLEQARGPHPSREVVRGLATALRLSDAERIHLHELAGVPLPRAGIPRHVRPSVQLLLERLPCSPAYVLSADFEILAWNDLTTALLGDFSVLPPRQRNFARWRFLGVPAAFRLRCEVPDAGELGEAIASGLRRAAARYPADPDLATLVAELRAGSDEFAALWGSTDVREDAAGTRKTLRHTTVGEITVSCDGLDIPDTDQRVVIYTADPGSPSEEALRLLDVIGTQALETPGPGQATVAPPSTGSTFPVT